MSSDQVSILHFALELLVLVMSIFTAVSNQKMRIEILSLKLWIVDNFHAKKEARLSTSEDSKG